MRSPSSTSSLDSLGRRKRRSSVRSRQHTSRYDSSSSNSSSSSSNASVSPRKRRRHNEYKSRWRSSSRNRRESFSRRRYHKSRSRSYSSRGDRNRRIDSREQSDGKKKVEKPAEVPVLAESASVTSKPANASTKSVGKPESIISDDIPDEERLKVLFGFSGFDSTKGRIVEDNLTTAATGACRKDTKREYRQYMNRLGGFNRPLDKR